MHPIANIRGATSQHLKGRRIVLAVTGSIAAVKTVELARELARHGAEVQAVMSDAATRIVHPDALQFATGLPVITRLSGGVEHVAMMGDVPDPADLLLVAPATANTISKIALGIDDTPITTFATVAVGANVPIVVAPAMHEVMLDHPVVAEHVATLRNRLGVAWVEPARDEHKAKLADVEAIVETVIRRLARTGGVLSGQRCLVVTGSTEEPMDAVRVLTNRSSGRTGRIIATELLRHGAEVTIWEGGTTEARPAHLDDFTTTFRRHSDLQRLADEADVGGLDQIWMPAAIGDYALQEASGKVASGRPDLTLILRPLGKIIETLRDRVPRATLVAFKAESDVESLVPRARDRLHRYRAQFVVANDSTAFSSRDTTAHLVTAGNVETFRGDKRRVFADLVLAVAGANPAPARRPPSRVADAPPPDETKDGSPRDPESSAPADPSHRGAEHARPGQPPVREDAEGEAQASARLSPRPPLALDPLSLRRKHPVDDL